MLRVITLFYLLNPCVYRSLIKYFNGYSRLYIVPIPNNNIID